MSNKDPEDEPGIVDSDEEPGTDDNASESLNQPREIGGRDGPDPTRYGDWEKAGRCIDF